MYCLMSNVQYTMYNVYYFSLCIDKHAEFYNQFYPSCEKKSVLNIDIQIICSAKAFTVL